MKNATMKQLELRHCEVVIKQIKEFAVRPAILYLNAILNAILDSFSRDLCMFLEIAFHGQKEAAWANECRNLSVIYR